MLTTKSLILVTVATTCTTLAQSSPNMKVYYHDESDEHPTATHDSTHEYLSLDQLGEIGVLGFPGQSMDQVDGIANERGYVARDEVRDVFEKLHRQRLTTTTD